MLRTSKKLEKFVITWVVILFVVIVSLLYLFIYNSKDIILGLIIGTLVSLLKFLMNSFNFGKILKVRMPNIFNLVLLNIFSLMLLFLILFLLLNKIYLVNIYTIVGVFIGVGLIPLVILIGGILQSLYIIRNKF